MFLPTPKEFYIIWNLTRIEKKYIDYDDISREFAEKYKYKYDNYKSCPDELFNTINGLQYIGLLDAALLGKRLIVRLTPKGKRFCYEFIMLKILPAIFAVVSCLVGLYRVFV